MSNVSRKKVVNVIKGKTLASTDLAPQETSTSAEAKIGRLVTPEVLRPEVEDVVLASPADTDAAYLEELKFSETLVELTISEDSSEFPIDPVPMSVNGKQIFVKRMQPTLVKRKYVECLTNPVLRVKTKKIKNNLDEDATVLEQTRSLQYPFSVTFPNPHKRDREWLRGLLTRG